MHHYTCAGQNSCAFHNGISLIYDVLLFTKLGIEIVVKLIFDRRNMLLERFFAFGIIEKGILLAGIRHMHKYIHEKRVSKSLSLLNR